MSRANILKRIEALEAAAANASKPQRKPYGWAIVTPEGAWGHGQYAYRTEASAQRVLRARIGWCKHWLAKDSADTYTAGRLARVEQCRVVPLFVGESE